MYPIRSRPIEWAVDRHLGRWRIGIPAPSMVFSKLSLKKLSYFKFFYFKEPSYFKVLLLQSNQVISRFFYFKATEFSFRLTFSF